MGFGIIFIKNAIKIPNGKLRNANKSLLSSSFQRFIPSNSTSTHLIRSFQFNSSTFIGKKEIFSANVIKNQKWSSNSKSQLSFVSMFSSSSSYNSKMKKKEENEEESFTILTRWIEFEKEMNKNAEELMNSIVGSSSFMEKEEKWNEETKELKMKELMNSFKTNLEEMKEILEKSKVKSNLNQENHSTLEELFIIYKGIYAQIIHLCKKTMKYQFQLSKRMENQSELIRLKENPFEQAKVTFDYLLEMFQNHGHSIQRIFEEAEKSSPKIQGKKEKVFPVSIITGFLGSGKTTLINHILRGDHGKKIAVIENEFGEIGIDDSLIQNAKKEMGSYQIEEDIIEMNNGCVCCSVRGDLVRILTKLMQRKKRFDHILIETTGLAHVAPVAQTFFSIPELADSIRLDGIITVVDAKHVLKHLDEKKHHNEINETVDQIAFADKILLNKCDLVNEGQLTEVEKRIRQINSFAQITRTQHSKLDVNELIDMKAFELERALEIAPSLLEDGHHHHHINVKSVGISFPDDLDFKKTSEWLSRLLSEKGEEIYRMKGVFNFKGMKEKFVFQGVHSHLTSEPLGVWGDERRESKLIFIGKNLERSQLEEDFKACFA